MAEKNTSAQIVLWLKGKGYSEEKIQKILAKLAEHDHQTLSDAVFDSIGGSGQSLDDLIGDLLKD